MLVDTRLVSVGMVISIYWISLHITANVLTSPNLVFLNNVSNCTLQSRFASGLQRLISPMGMLYNENFNQVDYIKTKAT
jgi:hypothetical protein